MTFKCFKSEYEQVPEALCHYSVDDRTQNGLESSFKTADSKAESRRRLSLKADSIESFAPAKHEPIQVDYACMSCGISRCSDPLASDVVRKEFSSYTGSRSRALLTRNQAKILETYFQVNPKPSSLVKKQLALETNLSSCRVANWFQNRRAKAEQLRKQKHFDYARTSPDGEHNCKNNKKRIRWQRQLREARSFRTQNASSDDWNDHESANTVSCDPSSLRTFAILLNLGNLSQLYPRLDQTLQHSYLTHDRGNVLQAMNVVFRGKKSDRQHMPLWKLFSRTTQGSRFHHASCKSTDTEDFLGWLSWQQNGLPGTPSRHLESPVLHVNNLPVAEDAIRCRRVLLEAVSKLASPSDRSLVRMLYIVAMSFTEISVSELYDALAVASDVDLRNNSYVGLRMTPVQLVDMFQISAEILQINTEEIVSFQDPAMRNFLIGSELPDFETGHLLMGRIYLQLLEQARVPNLIVPWSNFQEWYLQARDASLANYMARYGSEHCRQAQQTHPEICGEIHRSLLKACSESISLDNDYEELTVNAQWLRINLCYEASIIYDFDELQAAYEEMGASFDPQTSKLLPQPLTQASVTQSDAIYVLSAQEGSHPNQLPELHFRTRSTCSKRKHNDVENVQDALRTMDISTEGMPLQDHVSSYKPEERSESLETLASSLQTNYISWLARIEGNQTLSSDASSTTCGSEFESDSENSDSDSGDWEVIECKYCSGSTQPDHIHTQLYE